MDDENKIPKYPYMDMYTGYAHGPEDELSAVPETDEVKVKVVLQVMSWDLIRRKYED